MEIYGGKQMLRRTVIAVISTLILLLALPLGAQYPVTSEGKSPFVEVVRNVRESVVHIQVEAEVETRVPQGRFPFDDDLFRFFFGPMPETRRSVSVGSGFIFRQDGNDVYILTNNHVVDLSENQTITITLADKAKYRADVVGLDPMTDVAIIKITVPDNEQVSVIPLGSSENLEIGDWAIAIGNPFGQLGLDRTVTVGVISATSRASLNFGERSPIYQDYIQTDAAINPGHSGGPLLNIRGEAIGINAAITSTSGGNIGIGFAIPIDLARKVVSDFLEHGRVVRAYLGILPQEITPDLQQTLGLERIGGVLVAQVESDTPASRGGLRNGDVIIRLDGEEVQNVARFRILVANSEVGRRVPVTIIRNRQERTLHVELAELPEETVVREQREPAEAPLLGLEVVELQSEFAQRQQISADHGVVVSAIESNTPAHRSDLRVGDVIMEVNHRNVESVSDFENLIAAAKRDYEENDNNIILIYVLSRDGVNRYMTINLAE